MRRASTRAWCHTALRGTTQRAATHEQGVVAWVMTLRHKGQSGVCVSSSHASLDGAGCAVHVAGLRACVKAGVIVLTQPHCDQTCHTTNDHK